jgi:hypothetical protein
MTNPTGSLPRVATSVNEPGCRSISSVVSRARRVKGANASPESAATNGSSSES